MDLQQRVTSLDPQFATAWESQVVLMNLFEGLLTPAQGLGTSGSKMRWKEKTKSAAVTGVGGISLPGSPSRQTPKC